MDLMGESLAMNPSDGSLPTEKESLYREMDEVIGFLEGKIRAARQGTAEYDEMDLEMDLRELQNLRNSADLDRGIVKTQMKRRLKELRKKWGIPPTESLEKEK